MSSSDKNVIVGTPGDDILDGTDQGNLDGDNTQIGTADNDLNLTAKAVFDTIKGLDGDDILIGGDPDDAIDGGTWQKPHLCRRR